MPDSEDNRGAFHDFATGDHGSMAELARRLGVDPHVSSNGHATANDDYEFPPSPTLEGFCTTRCFNRDPLVEHFGVRLGRLHGRDALLYPTILGVDRAKFLDGNHPKYVWAEKGKGHVHWYNLLPAVDLIAAHGGVLYLANGEPSVWAGHQSGVPMVCLAGGENAQPTEALIEQLKEAIGYEHPIRVVFDRDDAGRRGAHKTVATLRAAGFIDVLARELPEDLGDKADVDDLHRKVGDGGLAAALTALPELANAAEGAATDQKTGATKRALPDLVDIARALVGKHPDDLAFDPSIDDFRRFDGTHWRREPQKSRALDTLVIEACRSMRMKVYKTTLLDGVLRVVSGLCIQQFDPRPDLINFANGTMDLATRTLRPHDPADYLTVCLPYDYAPGRYPRIYRFLRETMPDRLGRRAYMGHTGLGMMGDVTLHKALLLVGPPRSGKGTGMKVANAACGHLIAGFAGSVLFDRESEGMWSRHKWNRRGVVCIDELPAEALHSEELFKSITAHEGVPMRQMRAAEVLDNRWLAKLIMATNDRPRYGDRSGALTARLAVVECPNGRQEEDLDRQLLDGLLEELPAFAAACLAAGRQILREGRYPASDAMRKLLRDIEHRGDALKSWSADHLVIDAAAWTDTARLYGAYCAYCKGAGHPAMALERFTQALRDRFRGLEPKSRWVWVTIGGDQQHKKCRGLQGVRFRTEEDPDIDDEAAAASHNGRATGTAGTPMEHLKTGRCTTPAPEKNGAHGTAGTPLSHFCATPPVVREMVGSTAHNGTPTHTVVTEKCKSGVPGVPDASIPSGESLVQLPCDEVYQPVAPASGSRATGRNRPYQACPACGRINWSSVGDYWHCADCGAPAERAVIGSA